MLSILGVTTTDGWHVDIRSNRLLNKSMIERLNLMLKNTILHEANIT